MARRSNDQFILGQERVPSVELSATASAASLMRDDGKARSSGSMFRHEEVGAFAAGAEAAFDG